MIEMPNTIVEQYKTVEELRNSIHESMVIHEFQKDLLTSHGCMQILGLTYERFIDWLGEKSGKNFVDYVYTTNIG